MIWTMSAMPHPRSPEGASICERAAHFIVSAIAKKQEVTNTISMINMEKNKSMFWIVFVIGAVLSWGVYGVMLHQGQTQLKSPLLALLCVGAAYFLIGVIVPVGVLTSQNKLSLASFNFSSTMTATIADEISALGAE